ncbi:MAG: hypothetical protein QME78_07515 [Thermodesulfobacteriota bacterium]|nr:hypothetical protein [Thermodesulfobacteriota bacterium]
MGKLKPGDRGFLEKQAIGSVGNFAKDPKGRAIVPLQIQSEFRQIVTDQSRFLIQADPFLPESQSVKMVQLASGGIPLPDGAVVEGSTTFSFMVEMGSHELQSWSKIFQDTLDDLVKSRHSGENRSPGYL